MVALAEQDFPVAITQLLAGNLETQVKVPPGFISGPINFVDFHVFNFGMSGSVGALTTTNQVWPWTYSMRLLRSNRDEYEVEIEGSSGEFQFASLRCLGSTRTTRLIRMPKEKRCLYLAITPFTASSTLSRQAAFPPLWTLKSRRTPNYPPELQKSAKQGVVRIWSPISAEGKVSLNQAALLECPHPLFAASALEAIRAWKYESRGKVEKPEQAYLLTVHFVLRER